MNILLSGGAGYIGSHAALSLLDKGHSVHIVDNLSTGSKLLIPKNARFTNCNINDESKISDLIKSDKFDLLMHFAGFIEVEESVQQPEKYFENKMQDMRWFYTSVYCRLGIRNWSLIGIFHPLSLFPSEQSVRLLPFQLGVSLSLF